MKGAYGVAGDRFATLDPPTAHQGFSACEEDGEEQEHVSNASRWPRWGLGWWPVYGQEGWVTRPGQILAVRSFM